MPDSRTPRRFIAVRAATIATAIDRLVAADEVEGVAAFWTPADTETATVRT